MVEILELNGTAFGVAGIEMINVEFFIHLWGIQSDVLQFAIHRIHLARLGIKKGDHALLVLFICATESKKHVSMLENLTGTLIQP